MIFLLKHSRDIAFLSGVVYFIQGAMGVTGVALPLFLRSLKWSISEIAAVSAVAAVPWVIKIVYGLLSDSYPLLGYRRKSYLIMFSVCSVIGWGGLVFFPPEKAWILAAMILSNLGFAATDVITDGLIVEHSNEFTSPIYQSIAWGSRSMGSVVSGVTGGWLAQHWDPKYIFTLAMALPLMTSFVALWILEKRVEHPIFKSPIGTILATGKLMWTRNIRLFCVILFSISISAAFGTPYFFYLKESLGFSNTFLGMLASIGWFGAMVGSFIYAKLLRKVSPKLTLRWAIIVNGINIFSCMMIQNQTSAFILVFLGGVMGCLVMLPVMSSAAALTHHSGVEGTLFAVLMSIFNLGQILFGLAGAQAYHFIGLFPLIIITGFLAFTALFFVEKLRFETA